MYIESVIIFLLFQVSFLLGYILGRNSAIPYPASVIQRDETTRNSNAVLATSTAKNTSGRKNILIDNSKFVTSFEEKLQSNGKSLGNQTVVFDDVSSSVSKLAQLKGNK